MGTVFQTWWLNVTDRLYDDLFEDLNETHTRDEVDVVITDITTGVVTKSFSPINTLGRYKALFKRAFTCLKV